MNKNIMQQKLFFRPKKATKALLFVKTSFANNLAME
jgi:hypothetical protein